MNHLFKFHLHNNFTYNEEKTLELEHTSMCRKVNLFNLNALYE